jgi:hypothetical protein
VAAAIRYKGAYRRPILVHLITRVNMLDDHRGDHEALLLGFGLMALARRQETQSENLTGASGCLFTESENRSGRA